MKIKRFQSFFEAFNFKAGYVCPRNKYLGEDLSILKLEAGRYAIVRVSGVLDFDNETPIIFWLRDDGEVR